MESNMIEQDLTKAEPIAVFTRLLDLMRLAHDGCYDSEYNDFIKARLAELKPVLITKLDEFTTLQNNIHK